MEVFWRDVHWEIIDCRAVPIPYGRYLPGFSFWGAVGPSNRSLRLILIVGKSLSTLKRWISSAGRIIEIVNVIAHFEPYITRSLYNCFILSFLVE